MAGTLIFNKQSYITARALATKLGLRPMRLPESIAKFAKKGIYPSIRYGSSICDLGAKDTSINSPNVIKLCADSLAFSKFCEEHEIFSPVYNRFNPDKPPKFPFLLRSRWHRSGKDISTIMNKEDLEALPLDKLYNRYWVPFIPSKYEIRLHYIFGDVPRIFLKKPGEHTDDTDFIRTMSKGWQYSLQLELGDRYTSAQKTAMKVAELLKISFAGIDMAWIPDRKRYIIWEVNTAPGLNINTVEIYASRLREKLYE